MPVCVPEDARRIMPDMLPDFTTDVLRKVDLPDGDAALVARYLGECGFARGGLPRYAPVATVCG